MEGDEKIAGALAEVLERDRIDEAMGFSRLTDGERIGWLINMHETILVDAQAPRGKAAMDLYFVESDGQAFKSTIIYEPYLYVLCKPGTEGDVEDYLRKTQGKVILSMNFVEKEDLSLNNHLSGKMQKALRVNFLSMNNLNQFKRTLFPIINKNKKQSDINRAFDDVYTTVGLWYEVKARNGKTTFSIKHELVTRAEAVVLAFDIETTKLPLKFPEASIDQIMMISYMIDGQIVAEDIDDFEYTPKPEFEGPFTIFNEPDEFHVLQRFFEHIREVKPSIFVTYNGDFFDWPFIDARSQFHGLDMEKEIGFSRNNSGEYLSSYATHLDCFCWVKRDSYLPQGSHGLKVSFIRLRKAVTAAKLGYNPIEIDPEDMTVFAASRPQTLAQYSVSDAVATYYLYMKYVNPFIFSLCNIIPMNPDDVLRRGSGTLCETLLMVEAFKANVIMPNKHQEKGIKMADGYLLDSETYVGGHVEALRAGVYRSDIPIKFALDSAALDTQALEFSVTVEGGLDLKDVVNFDETKQEIIKMLSNLRDNPFASRNPLIYHLDVSAMYPNIILTNRLQPDAMVDDGVCAACDFNEGPQSTCQRRLDWLWRGELFTAKKGDIQLVKNQLQSESFIQEGKHVSFDALPEAEQAALLKKRVQEYSRKVYGKVHETKTIEKEAIICQRENPFYINTVRNFRDRRYHYKNLHKEWKGNLEKYVAQGDAVGVDNAKKRIIVYDSLQLAHKCILNSFYGYVMRKGARWYSMEMAGIVCYTGSKIIQLARRIVDKVGLPLELDTDGIWCILPKGFPEDFKLQLTSGKVYKISYPCVMLNHLVHKDFTNEQYQDRVAPGSNEYVTRKENSILFEVDGPYHAMILPASTEADKLLKKRYAVFNHSGKLTEIKGFELKRRGELKLIKEFQSNIFKVFLEGKNLQECYDAVACVANKWLDILYTKGKDVSDDELFELISENRSMSKALDDYGNQKSTSICTARRLAEFLGDQMARAKGLNCKFVISAKPTGAPVSERAVPVVIFQAESHVRNHFLRKWLKDNALVNFDIRALIDWNYYLERFGSVLQKLITIPAAMQDITNPIPRLAHPDWLQKRLRERAVGHLQPKIAAAFQAVPFREKRKAPVDDLEDSKKTLAIGNAVPVAEKVEVVPPETLFSNYGKWIGNVKQTWKKKLREFNQARKSQSQGAFVKQLSHTWHILQLTETEIAGEYRLWVWAEGKVRLHRLQVPRTFFLVTTPEFDSKLFQIAKQILVERSNPPKHLGSSCLAFKVSVPELIYQRNHSIFANLEHDPSVLGVYENETKVLFKTLCLMSNISMLRPGFSRSRLGPDDMFYLGNLDFGKADSTGYLESVEFKFCYLFHSVSAQTQVFSFVSFADKHVTTWFVDPGKRTDSLPNVSRMYLESIEKQSSVPSIGESFFPGTMTFTNRVVATESDAFKGLTRFLRDYLSRHKSDSVLLLQSALPQTLLSGTIIGKELPYVLVPSHSREVSTLNWQIDSIKKMMVHLMNLGTWFDEKLMLARYADLPIGNIDDDYPIFLTDVFVARRMMQSDIYMCANADKAALQRESDVVINKKGFYPNVSLEFDISHLAFNTIIQSTLVAEMEGISSQSEGAIGGMVGVPVDASMSVIKSIVKAWWLQIEETGEQVPQILLEHFNRWLESPTSQVHDPGLAYLMRNMMRKVFVQLVAEFQRLGAEVLYGNMDKIVIHTNKTCPKRALAYGAYIIDSILKKPLFQLLSIDPKRIYCQLFWIDVSNKGAFSVDPDRVLEQIEPVPFLDWNMAEYLPPRVKDAFEAKLSHVMQLVHKIHSDQGLDDSKRAQIMQDYISHELKGELLKLTPVLSREWQRHQLRETPDPAFKLPLLPGATKQVSEPILEFVKFFVQILSLYATCDQQVRVLRRDLLNVIGCKEFDLSAEFRNPSACVVLRQVICEYCSSTHDLNLTSREALVASASGNASLKCQTCNSKYNPLMLEQILLDTLMTQVRDWQLQDLKCTSCRMITNLNLRLYCACSRNLSTSIDLDQVKQNVLVYGNIASFYGMSLLEEFTQLVQNQIS